MIKNILFVCFNLVICYAQSQSIQWASRVLDVSTELSPLQYSAQQVLGEPDVSLKGEDSPNAWSPRRNNKVDFVKVGFAKAIQIQQIAIHESLNPGAVSQVFAYDRNNNEHLMFTLDPKPLPIKSRFLNIFFDLTSYEVKAIKVVIDGDKVPGENSIDAISMSDSNVPISVTVKLAANINNDLPTERLSSNVNSQYIEHSPLLSPDGKTLFFSRANHPDNIGGADDLEDIWYSELDEATGEWKEAQNMGDKLNSKGPNFISSISQDGDKLVILLGNRYLKNGKMRAGVSMSIKEGDTWSEPQNIEILNNYNFSSKADYYMAPNLKVMLMSIERDDTYGWRDIYVSFKRGDGDWTEPKNIGPVVNTASDETSPFMAEDNETLYFSTSGFSGYGRSDIYVTKRLDKTWTNWSVPENMGSGVNSEADDIYFNIPQTGDYAYFTQGNIDENSDIYRFNINDLYLPTKVIVKGKVMDSDTKQPLAAVVVIERLPDGKEIARIKTNPETGAYEYELEYGAKYGFNAEVDGFMAVSESVDLNEQTTVREINTDLLLTPIKVEAIIVLNNIFFDFDKAILKTSSISELRRLIGYFTGKAIKVMEISGHTDSVGPEKYNLGLSKRRAKAVSNYLINNGISSESVQVKWFGESKPVVSNDTEENRSKNRRVEFKVVEK